MTKGVPADRIRALNGAAVQGGRKWVLYWMIAARRSRANFALQRAVDLARDLRKPLVVFEALGCGYPWASERLHTFVVQGMAENAVRFGRAACLYVPYVEPEPGGGEGLLDALAARAAVVVTDDFPAFVIPRMVAAAARRLDVRLEVVDSNGLLPLESSDRVFPTAFSFRAFLQRSLPPHLERFPLDDPLDGVALPPIRRLPVEIERRWRLAPPDALASPNRLVGTLPIVHRVEAVGTTGGSSAAGAALRTFLEHKLARYREERNVPDADASSGLSPYLHFGHISVHEVFAALATRERWTRRRLGRAAGGRREGWWGMSADAEAFLDQIVTWRELGFNMCRHGDDYDRYESLPGWARATLESHAADPRRPVYTLAQLESAATHDRLWNAAQRQLVREGRQHNYLRMLWGKKILEWSAAPRDALACLIELNNKYALDGRDPNSYSGIFWCLGRYDRPWGPERPVFGTVRYMSSDNTARKVSVRGYLRRYSDG